MTTPSDEKDILHFYVDGNKQFTITCPKCGYKRTMDVSDKIPAGRTVKAKCRCGHRFALNIDFRRLYRKKVNLPGQFLHLKTKRNGDIMIKDISKGGIGFTYHGPLRLRVMDYIEISFHLNDTKKSHIQKRVTIKSIHNKFYGTQFEDDGGYDPNLGFYLMP